MYIFDYAPTAFGVCAFASMCAVIVAAKPEHRKKLLCIQCIPLLLLLVRFGPCLGGLEWRITIRRPLNYACAVLPFAGVLLGAHVCGAWKQKGRQAPATALALVLCLFVSCTLVFEQFWVYSDLCMSIEVRGEQVEVVTEDFPPGGSLARKYYLYVDETFRGLEQYISYEELLRSN